MIKSDELIDHLLGLLLGLGFSPVDMGQRDQDYVLSGIVELDDAYFGAPKSNGKRGRGTEKTSALAAMSLTEQGHPRFLKIQASKLDPRSVSVVAQQAICPNSETHSDALGSFRAALREEYGHHFQVFDQDSNTLRWVHTLISNVKFFNHSAVFLPPVRVLCKR